MEKTICRMFCYNDDLYILPWSFDRWREWVNMRKLYRYWLDYLNKRASMMISDKAHAFHKWKHLNI